VTRHRKSWRRGASLKRELRQNKRLAEKSQQQFCTAFLHFSSSAFISFLGVISRHLPLFLRRFDQRLLFEFVVAGMRRRQDQRRQDGLCLYGCFSTLPDVGVSLHARNYRLLPAETTGEARDS